MLSYQYGGPRYQDKIVSYPVVGIPFTLEDDIHMRRCQGDFVPGGGLCVLVDITDNFKMFLPGDDIISPRPHKVPRI